jgi:hypothetical protein
MHYQQGREVCRKILVKQYSHLPQQYRKPDVTVNLERPETDVHIGTRNAANGP